MFEAVLSDETIMDYNKKKILIEQPISKVQLQPNSVDLTLGNTWKKLKKNVKKVIHVYYSSSLSSSSYCFSSSLTLRSNSSSINPHISSSFVNDSRIPFGDDRLNCLIIVSLNNIDGDK